MAQPHWGLHWRRGCEQYSTVWLCQGAVKTCPLELLSKQGGGHFLLGPNSGPSQVQKR